MVPRGGRWGGGQAFSSCPASNGRRSLRRSLEGFSGLRLDRFSRWGHRSGSRTGSSLRGRTDSGLFAFSRSLSRRGAVFDDRGRRFRRGLLGGRRCRSLSRNGAVFDGSGYRFCRGLLRGRRRRLGDGVGILVCPRGIGLCRGRGGDFNGGRWRRWLDEDFRAGGCLPGCAPGRGKRIAQDCPGDDTQKHGGKNHESGVANIKPPGAPGHFAGHKLLE